MARTAKSRRFVRGNRKRRTIKARGLSFGLPRPRVAPRGRAALLAPPKGLGKAIGPRSWKNVPMKVEKPPKSGTGKGGKQVMLSGLGAQTQRAPGPSLF